MPLSTITSNYRALILSLLLSAASLLTACQSGKLPEADSQVAKLYVKRCGECHRAYNPHEMTAAMWAVKVDAMQDLMRRAGVPPLTTDERKTILNYLTRNAGTQ
ncbi:MAG TPA: hypothetical protein VFB33_15395 [Candidatus Binataceae bacterium]|nr:hypothetical protein [Candidatus Binataceae bacterium]